MTNSPGHAVRSELNLRERMFLRFCCLPPPPVPVEPRDAYDDNPPVMGRDPLNWVRRMFGDRFEQAVRDRVMLDIGCGLGDQVLGAVQAGSRSGVGIEVTDLHVRVATARAVELGIQDRVRFTTDPVSTLGAGWADVVLSQNSFEHFADPPEILAQAYEALKPGGQFFITFGPTWWHPYGAHHFFMIKVPWSHRIFSERTILKVRRLYRPNTPTQWRDVALNRMTVAKFLAILDASPFLVSDFRLTPIRPLPLWLVRLRLFREWTNANVSVILTKPS